MNRRRFLFASAGAGITVGAAGAAMLVKGFEPPPVKSHPPKHLPPQSTAGGPVPWTYRELDPERSAERSYRLYPEGSCMYAVFGSIISQLAEQHGEPYSTFPVAMMKYGASGIGGYGSACGALNGAAAVMGLFVGDKDHQESLVEDLFTWYEQTSLPVYSPPDAKQVIEPTQAESVLCHVSTTRWATATGRRVDGKERAERCSRLSADVARKTVAMLNTYHAGRYVTASQVETGTSGCLQCHGKTGKLGTVKAKMDCAACHDASAAHTLFADVHYKFMD